MPHSFPTRRSAVLLVVEPGHQQGAVVEHPVGEHAEALLRELVLGDAMEVVERRLGAPAEREEPVHVGLRPVEYAFQLVPVPDLLEGKLLNRRGDDDEAVELLLRDDSAEALLGKESVGTGRIRWYPYY